MTRERSPASFVFTLGASHLLLSLALRILLSIREIHQGGSPVTALPRILGLGLLHDLHVLLFLLIPGLLFSLLLGSKLQMPGPQGRLLRASALTLTYFGVVFLCFTAFVEWFFWDEFSSRFNFIAVDYLIYTTEVLGNIRQSYNVPFVVGAAFALAALPFGLMLRLSQRMPALGKKTKGLALVCTATLLVILGFLKAQPFPSGNTLTDQLGLNGPKAFVHAYFTNRLDYRTFFRTLPDAEMLDVMEAEFRKTERTEREPSGRLVKIIEPAGEERRPNVVFLMVESLSAEFLAHFGNRSNITPHLDRLIPESLFFTNLYATGTRTARGIEAAALALPPTPGQSAIRRPDIQGLFTMGTLFQRRGYQTSFIYGGWGFFDNMNAFFEGNGFTTVDRSRFHEDEIHFTTAWGVCDEDLLDRTLKEGDQAHAAARPFFFHVITTSNHRPFAYPPNRIDLPSVTSGRNGAVKYTDHALHRFLEQARTRPWFPNTVFILMADHAASGRGKVSIPVPTYHIPLWIYAPHLIRPRLVPQVASEIDLAPTLFGLLNWKYRSYFLGHDLLKPGASERFFSGTYQAVGMYEERHFVELGLKGVVREFAYNPASRILEDGAPPDAERVKRAVAHYQYADWILGRGLYR